MTSLLGLAGILGVVFGPPVGYARFEFVLELLIDAGVFVSGAVVLVRAWVGGLLRFEKNLF